MDAAIMERTKSERVVVPAGTTTRLTQKKPDGRLGARSNFLCYTDVKKLRMVFDLIGDRARLMRQVAVHKFLLSAGSVYAAKQEMNVLRELDAGFVMKSMEVQNQDAPSLRGNISLLIFAQLQMDMAKLIQQHWLDVFNAEPERYRPELETQIAREEEEGNPCDLEGTRALIKDIDQELYPAILACDALFRKVESGCEKEEVYRSFAQRFSDVDGVPKGENDFDVVDPSAGVSYLRILFGALVAIHQPAKPGCNSPTPSERETTMGSASTTSEQIHSMSRSPLEIVDEDREDVESMYSPQPKVSQQKVVNAVMSFHRMRSQLAPTPSGLDTVERARQQVREILHGKGPGDDDRMVVIVGPCSIHDVKAAREYAALLVKEAEKHQNELVVVMRTYFEKPRSTVGWKGLFNDPDLDGTFELEKGIRLARELLVDVNDMGLPCATEFLDPWVAPYLSDLISWGAIGARTAESQTHREMVSGLPCPIGLKNATSGDVQVAIDAVQAGKAKHYTLGLLDTPQRQLDGSCTSTGVLETKGNPDGHVVLRGGKQGPNYSEEHVQAALEKIRKLEGVAGKLVIDCSHGNSNKDFTRQPLVISDICKQVAHSREHGIAGVMIESHLNSGNQKVPKLSDSAPVLPFVGQRQAVLEELKYGVSITDGCVDFGTTKQMLEDLAMAVRNVRSDAGGQA